MAYEWCSVICKEHPDLRDVKELLFLSLKIGFRGLDPQSQWANRGLTHMKPHQQMVKIVFESGSDDVIGDFLHAQIMYNPFHRPLLSMCAKYLVGLQCAAFTSQRLR